MCIHSGSKIDKISGGVNTPIFTSTSYAYLETEDRLYPRYFNTPNQQVLIDKMCALEGGEDGLFFSSGMAAICTSILGLVRQGDHIVFQPGLYGGTFNFVQHELSRLGIEFTIAETADIADFKRALQANTRAIYIESPSNPLLTITDIGAVAAVAQEGNIVSMIDSTFASPVNQNPISLGIDVVMHSATKYLGGHSDICAGAVVSSKEIMTKIRSMSYSLGGSLDAFTCYLLERSMKTLIIRVQEQNKNAQHIAQFLDKHTAIDRVFYPGLEDHQDHKIACIQMKGFGGMVSFEVKGMDHITFQKRLKLIKPSMSLGGVESIICAPIATSHRNLSNEERMKQGIGDNLLRLSVGIEDINDLLSDLDQALK